MTPGVVLYPNMTPGPRVDTAAVMAMDPHKRDLATDALRLVLRGLYNRLATLYSLAEGGRGTAEAWSRRGREVSWEREIRAEDGGEATARSLVRLGAPPRPSGGASCRTKGARPAPFPQVSSRCE